MTFEKDIDKTLIATETKKNLKNLKLDIEKTKLGVKEEMRKQQLLIIEEAKKRPEILDYNPDIIDELKTGPGLERFLKKFEIDVKIIDELYFNVPELNKIFLDYDLNSGFSYMENYFSGFWSEDKFRYDTHMGIINDFERIYEGDIDEMVEVNEIHIGENTKTSIREYLRNVRTDEFKEYSLSYAKSIDNYRIDIGLVISRPPIFLGY
jgi:hypothetical protein